MFPIDNDTCAIEDALKQQAEFVKSHENIKLQKGTAWFLLAKPWYEKWQSYVGISHNPLIRPEKPDAIDNASLLENGNLKDFLHEDIDFVVLPENVWTKLVEWYGLKDGQSPLKCPVIERGTFTKELRVEFYPLPLKLAYYKTPNQSILARFSRNDTLGQLVEHMRKLFIVDNSKEVKLVSKTYGLYEDLAGDAKSLSDLDLAPETQVILVEKEGDRWGDPAKVETSDKNSRSWNSGTDASVNKPDGPSVSSKALNNSFNRSYEPSNKKGLCGLSNLGNTCFMNSALQCLSNVPELTQYFLDKSWENDINTTNPLGTKGILAKKYAELITTIWDGKLSCTSPHQFKRAVGDFAPRFSGYQQQDSQELMAFLLDGLHEDLNRVKQKPYIETKEVGGRPEMDVAKESWGDYLKRNDSKIVDLFHGQLRSRLVCPKCHNISITFDPFCYLSLPLPNEMDLEFLFVCDFSVNIPKKCRAKIPKNCTVAIAKGFLSKFLNVPTDWLKLATISRDSRQGSNFKRFLENNYKLKLSADEQVVVYMLEPAEGNVFVGVYLRNRESIFGIPIMISVPEKVTYESLCMAMLKLCSRILKDDTTGTDEPMDQDGATVVESKSAYPFKVTKVAQYGTITELEGENSIMLENNEKLAIEFEFEKLPDAVNSAASKFVEDDSVKLESQSKASVDLSDCLTWFTLEEQLGENDTWYCPKCKEHVQAYKKFDLWKLPKYLVIQLKRFQYTSHWRDKIDVFVDYPVKDLNLSYWVKGEEQKTSYNLIAVSNHFGGLGGGHYTAHGRNYLLGEWYYFDDSSVSKSSASSAVSKSGYVLVYERSEEK